MGKVSQKKKGLIRITEPFASRGGIEDASKASYDSTLEGNVQKTTSIFIFIPILIILLVSFAVYFNALSGDFVYDDKDQVINNPWIRDIVNMPTIFSKSVLSFQSVHSTSNYYRPLMHIIFMLNYYIFGLKPWGFHLVNVIFHCGVSVLVFLIIGRFLTEHRVTKTLVYLSPSFIAAILFATHPIHTEAVTWIAGLPDVAFTFFYLISFYLYMLFRDGAKRCYPLSILSFSMAILFKEPALTLPIILIVYDYLMKKMDDTLPSGIKRYIPYVVVSGIYLLVRHNALGNFAPMKSYTELSTYQLIINIFPLFREYLTSLLWPFNLNFWPTFHPIYSIVEVKGIISLVVTGIFLIAVVAAYRKNRLLFFGLLLLVIPLLPTFYIKGISGKPFAERYLYLPSVGFVLLLAIVLSWAMEKLPHAIVTITIGFFMAIAGVYAVGTISRNNIWQDNFIFWSDTVKKSPDLAEAHNNLGAEYAFKGQLDRAIPEYQTALQLAPDYADAHNNLGAAYASQGQQDRAIAEYQTALRLNSDSAETHYNLGAAYASQGQLDRAIAEYQTALRLKPDYAEVYGNLGAAYASQGQLDRAIAEYQTALQLVPDLTRARQRLNDILSRQH